MKKLKFEKTLTVVFLNRPESQQKQHKVYNGGMYESQFDSHYLRKNSSAINFFRIIYNNGPHVLKKNVDG